MDCKIQEVLICMVVLYQVLNSRSQLFFLSSILPLKICSKLFLSLSVCTTLSSCIFSANPYITSFFPISLESVLAWFGVGALFIVVDKLLCFVTFSRGTLISLSIDEKSLPVPMDCFKEAKFFISEVSF